MRLTESEFWGMNWRLFDALVQRYGNENLREDIRSGQIAQLIANGLYKRDRPVQLSDFVPNLPAPKPQTADEMIAALKMVAMMTNKGTNG